MSVASMQDPLAKLARAVEHVDLFEAESKSLIDPNSYHIVHELDQKGNRQIWRFNSPTPFVPIRLSTIVGDALFNFRSALDQLVWQLVLANHAKPGRHNSFPIVIAGNFRADYHETCLKGISSTAFTMIKASEPKPGKNWELSFLPELNDIDKHRHLNLFVVSIAAVTIRGVELEDGFNLLSPDAFGKVESGKVLCAAPIERQSVGVEPIFGIEASETGKKVPAPANKFLRNIERTIRDIFCQLEPEVNRE